MRQRTEDEIIRKAPIEVQFGEKKFEIRPLTILKQREWRQRLNDELGSVVDNFKPGSTSRAMANGLTVALLDFPDKLAELLFSYAPYLPKDEILETATEEQIAVAFSQVMQVAYPFLAQLGTVTQIVRSSLSRIQ